MLPRIIIFLFFFHNFHDSAKTCQLQLRNATKEASLWVQTTYIGGFHMKSLNSNQETIDPPEILFS